MVLNVKKMYTCTEIKESEQEKPVKSIWVKIQRKENNKDTIAEVCCRTLHKAEILDNALLDLTLWNLQGKEI